jgi:hypothetical protein
MAPVVHRLERKYADQVAFVYLDVDDDATAPLQKQLRFYGVVPQFLLVDGDGHVFRQWFGTPTSVTLDEALQDALTR